MQVRVAFNTSDGPVAEQAFPALFGGALPLDGGRPLRLGLAEPAHGCNASADPARWTHHAVLARRGDCSFADKARAAQAGNATLLILYNNDDTGSATSMLCRSVLCCQDFCTTRCVDRQPDVCVLHSRSRL